MPVRPIYEWSETEIDNQFPAADGGCLNNWVGADVNDAARARMSAVASWYQSQEFPQLIYASAPWGSLGSITRIDATTFDINKLISTHFPVGRRLILYVAGVATEEVFVVSATEGVPAAGWTRIVVNGTVPVGIDNVGFANLEQMPGSATGEYGNPEYGIGTTAARNAAAVKEGLLWFNTSDHKLELYYGGAWRTVAVIPTASGSLTRSGWDSANGNQDFTLDIAAPTSSDPIVNFAINSILRGAIKGTTTGMSFKGGPSAGSLSEIIIGNNVLTFDGNDLRPGFVDAGTLEGSNLAAVITAVQDALGVQYAYMPSNMLGISSTAEILIPSCNDIVTSQPTGTIELDPNAYIYSGTNPKTLTLRVRLGPSGTPTSNPVVYSNAVNCPAATFLSLKSIRQRYVAITSGDRLSMTIQSSTANQWDLYALDTNVRWVAAST